MEARNNFLYIKSDIKGHNIVVHMWISESLTEAECDVLKFLLKGCNTTKISQQRSRSIKTVSIQKQQIYRKLGIRNDITFWIDILLSPSIKVVFCNNDKIIDIGCAFLKMPDNCNYLCLN
ncbi:TPA: LuxR family transcriptional regulator [Escherichia coli]|nr:helix-turn-helix transcriptional regulator [Escherichia coli]HAJ7145337.1 LuxR family transcriptional regulator [Escherichia coli]HAJ7257580.1 LuxR family transcriptional regulator [Escherichia coli]HAJ7262372.1 LuxR family transcriptional regulator [Escherichia coli]HBA2640924.1 helix-turn-helix transcriptional regulator [Escherichia coli]